MQRFDEALNCFLTHLSVSREYGERRAEAAAIGNLAKIYAAVGDYPRSLELSEEHRRIAVEIEDLRSEILALGNLGATSGAWEILKRLGSI
jgi:hypothetical protein